MTTFTVPATTRELEEFLSDQDKVTNLLTTSPTDFRDVVAAYVKNVADRDGEIRRQIDDQVKSGIRDFLKDAKNEGFKPAKRVNLGAPQVQGTNRGQHYCNTAPGVKIEDEYPDGVTYGQFMKDTWFQNNTPASQNKRNKLLGIQNAMSSLVPSDGGFLIPEILRAELLRVALETAVVRSRARVIPMDSLRVPFPIIDSTTNVGSVYGGIVGYWTEEAGAATASNNKFGRVVLEARKLTGYTEVPNELFLDSVISLNAFLDQIFPEALAFFEDVAFMGGNGVGQPLGCIGTTHPAQVTVTKEVGQPASSIVWENIVKMYSRMLPSSLGRAVWVASPDTFPQLATMALSVGTGGAPVWLANGQAGAPMTILGRPVVITEKAPALGATGDITFVDFGYYLIGDRMQLSAATSQDFKFSTDQTAVRFIERVDGRPWLQSPITPANGSSNTLSAFVKIEAR